MPRLFERQAYRFTLVGTHESGGRVRLLGISKRGDTYLRTLLIHGARALMTHSKKPPEWAIRLSARRPKNRIGQLMLQKGALHGRQIVPRDWVELSTSSTPIEPALPGATIPLGYGYQWWTLHGTGAYTAIGLQGQFIYVDPATETVVVKLSYFPPGAGNGALEDESLAFFRAVSAWSP